MLHFSSFQRRAKGPAEGADRCRNGAYGVAKMANTGMVARCARHDGRRALHHKTGRTEPASAKPTRTGSSFAQEVASGGLSFIRESYRQQGLSRPAIDTIMQSWRTGTLLQYRPYIGLWVAFASSRCDFLSPPAKEVVEFLCDLHIKKYTYNQICMARSAVSSVVSPGSSLSIGNHPLVKRYMKGLFELEPQFPKYSLVWDLSILLRYMRMLDDPANLPLGLLGKKLAIMICILAGGQRCQTIHAINVPDIRIVNGTCYIPFYTKLKQTKRGRHLAPLEFKVYGNPKLCVITNLTEYLKKTQAVRTDGALFISYQKPHRRVSKDTISRWVKEMMVSAGINTEFVTHSSRSAASSYADLKGVSLKDICRACGWSSARTFATHYRKEVVEETNMAEALLQ